MIVRVYQLHIEHDDILPPLVQDLVETLSSLIAPVDIDQGRQTRVAQFASRYRLAFSLLNEDASLDNSVMGWDVRKGIEGAQYPTNTFA